MRTRCFIAVLTAAFLCTIARGQSRYDIIIDECFPDPAPSAGLPASSFIELKNISATTYNLRNWKISNGSSTAAIKAGFLLKPDSFVLICAIADTSEYNVYGPTIGISSFPSLSNSEGVVILRSAEGITIHSLAYNRSWYGNEVKSRGGWTLEMIDTKYPCIGSGNWTASISENGGTPGKKNSVDGSHPDQQSPSLLRTYTIAPSQLIAVFDEGMDSNSASIASNYELDQGIGSPIEAKPLPPDFREVALRIGTALSNSQVYLLSAHDINDCSGNPISVYNTAKTGIASIADSQNIVLNEILFNPSPDGFDYVELYNRSHKIFDFHQLYFSDKNNGDLHLLCEIPYLFFPGEYFVFTENKDWLVQEYVVKDPSHIIELASLPSLPDDKGNIILLNNAGVTVDALAYNHSWQFPLLVSEQGVALERLNADKPTQNPLNWSSAASTAGFGTPTAINSEWNDGSEASDISISPRLFSPDHDGNDDFCFLHYKMPSPGFVMNTTIYNVNGIPVRKLVTGNTLSMEGDFRWDGLDDQQKLLPIGRYIVYAELFNPSGSVRKFKTVVVLAGKF